MTEEYITLKEAAQMLHVTREALQYHVKKGHLPVIATKSETGRNNAYIINIDDVETFRKEHMEKPVKMDKKKTRMVLHLYEIILISCGQRSVLFKTCDPREYSRRYVELIEHGHKYIRARVDGTELTIHDSDKLANRYHPRIRKGEAI